LIFFHLTAKAQRRLSEEDKVQISEKVQISDQAHLSEQDRVQISKYDAVKDNYFFTGFFAIMAISVLSAATLLSYLPNITTDNIFYQLSFWGGITGILGCPLTIVGSHLINHSVSRDTWLLVCGIIVVIIVTLTLTHYFQHPSRLF